MNEIIIRRVSEPYGYFGNMSFFPIIYNSLKWRTAEALFQSLRFAPNHPVIEQIRIQTSPVVAKSISSQNESEMVVIPRTAADVESLVR